MNANFLPKAINAQETSRSSLFKEDKRGFFKVTTLVISVFVTVVGPKILKISRTTA